MVIIKGTTEFRIQEKTAVVIGKFDGIHRGHKALLTEILEAKKKNLRSAVFTFAPSPSVFFKKGQGKELTTTQERRYLFAQMGIDYLVEYPFCEQTALLRAEHYVKEFLVRKMNAQLVVAGEDLCFGHRGAGNAGLLEKMGKEEGFSCHIIKKLYSKDRIISSTYVREMIEKGEMEQATHLLGSPFFIRGVVSQGNKLGRKLGMPTANLYPPQDKMLPPKGVYFSQVSMGDDLGSGKEGKERCLYGITNIGCKPTVNDTQQVSVETYLYNVNENFYEKVIQVHLLHFKRAERRFGSLESLKEAIKRDVSDGEKYFSFFQKN